MTDQRRRRITPLVLANLSWAKGIARQQAAKNYHPDIEELEAEAVVGLIQAARSYDPARADDFRGWAFRRVRGAILDWLRRQDTIGRGTRAARKRKDPNWTDTKGVPHQIYGDVRDLDGGSDRPPDMPAAHSNHEDRSELSAVIARIDDLPPKQGVAIYIHLVLDQSLKEVGRLLGVTESRACQLVKEARAMLGARVP